MMLILCAIQAFVVLGYATLVAYTSLRTDHGLQGTILGAMYGVRSLLFAVAPYVVYNMNSLTGVNFGHPYSGKGLIVSPTFLFCSLFNLLALPLLYFLEPVEIYGDLG